MTGKIVLVQPLHDQDDAAGLLVIETAKHGVIEPSLVERRRASESASARWLSQRAYSGQIMLHSHPG
jgi:hypothetical protein